MIFSGLSLLLASVVLPFMFERLRIENGSLGLLMVAVCLLGYTFFYGILPESVLVMIEELNPCRLSFVVVFFTVTQFVFTAMLAVDVFCNKLRFLK